MGFNSGFKVLKVESSIKYFQIIIVRAIQLLSTQRCLGKVYVLLSVYCKIRHHFLMGDSLSSDLQNIHSNISDVNQDTLREIDTVFPF